MAPNGSSINGVEYVPGYLSQDANERLLSAVDEHAWQMSVDHRVQVHGYQYHYKTRAAYRIGELPPWAARLAPRGHHDGFIRSVPNQIVANESRAQESSITSIRRCSATP